MPHNDYYVANVVNPEKTIRANPKGCAASQARGKGELIRFPERVQAGGASVSASGKAARLRQGGAGMEQRAWTQEKGRMAKAGCGDGP